ncbi:hypothetical protein FRC04_005462 [Tulasnella sp. 424]|nr:hypothetical protein FRC04_005462 [Tulasnella sp. 424]
MANAPPKSPRPGSGEATLSPPGNPGGLRKSASQPGLSETHPVVEELARRIGSSPSRKETREASPAPHGTPRTRDNADVDDRPSPFQRSITERLAALSSPPTFSPRSASDAPPPEPSNGLAKRFAAADFGAPPLPKSTPTPIVSSTLSFATSSPRSPSKSPAPSTKALPETPATKSTTLTPTQSKPRDSLTSTPTQSKPRDSLTSVNRPVSGLLTPSSTPNQSPMGTPPTRVINITSPPGSASRIPSLRARHSIASISSPPPGSQNVISTVTAATINTPTTQFGATPSRQTGGGLSKQETPSRIPSVSPRVQSSSSSSISSPKSAQTPSKTNQYKSSLATIAASPNSSPASTIIAKDKPKRPSVTIPLNAEEDGDDDARCQNCKDLLYGMSRNGRIVSVPVPEEGEVIKRYHAECFRCDACGDPFAEVDGAASFVRYEGGVRHLECTPTKHIQTFKHPAYEPMPQLRDVKTVSSKPTQSERASKPPTRPASMYASTSGIPRPNFASHQAINSMPASVGAGSRIPPPAPRFGSATVCPGCQVSVSPMERGIVPGPAATKWHAPCLVCGGKEHSRRVSAAWKIRDEVKGPGCGKKLDSAAKGDLSVGVLWCRDCWDVMRAQPGSPGTALSPTQSSSSSNSIFPSLSRPGSSLGSANLNADFGTTTLARQMSRSGAASPVRRPFMFPAPSSTAAISEQNVTQEGDSATQYLGGRISPLKNQDTGTGNRISNSPVRPQYSGVYGQSLRSVSPVRRQYTGMMASSPSVGSEVEAQPLAIQYTGGGVPVTRQLTTSRRPKSALGTRSFMSQKSIDEGRGMFLVRQMTGQASAGEDQS